MIRVLFVCTANICRSPTAEGLFRHEVRQENLESVIEVDSAGTDAYKHAGKGADARSQKTALERGIDLGTLRARQVVREDFERFDYILAMDRSHFTILQRMAPPGTMAKIGLFLEFAPALRIIDVPDPYYGGPYGFDRVFDMVEAACRGLLEHIRLNDLHEAVEQAQ